MKSLLFLGLVLAAAVSATGVNMNANPLVDAVHRRHAKLNGTISKCSICEDIVEDLISKGTCTGADAACLLIPPPGDLICDGIVACCCSVLLHYIQEHIGDAHAICGRVHMCALPPPAAAKKLAAAVPVKSPSPPILPNQLALDTVGIMFDATQDRNLSWSATIYDDYAIGARRMDFSHFGERGSRWVEGTNTHAPTESTLIGQNCTERRAYAGPPLVNDPRFWENATYEGTEQHTLIGTVEKFTLLKDRAFYVGFFRALSDGSRVPAELWVHFLSALRVIDVIAGTESHFDRNELVPCVNVPRN